MMAELVFVDNIPCTVVGHYGDYIHYCRIDNDTPGEGTVQDHMLVYSDLSKRTPARVISNDCSGLLFPDAARHELSKVISAHDNHC